MFPKSAPQQEVALLGYNTLLDVADVVCLRQQPAELFRNLLPHLRATIPCEFINFALYDPIRRTMTLSPWSGDEPWPRAPQEVAVEDSAAGWVWKNQRILSIGDLQLEKRFERGLHWLRDHGLRSYCVIPLTTYQQKLGALGVGSARPQAFGASEERFLLRVAEIIALSLDHSQPQHALIEEEERIRLLLEICSLRTCKGKVTTAELHENVAHFLAPLQKWARQSYVGLYFYEPETRSLRLYTRDRQLEDQWAVAGTASLEGSVAGRTFLRQEPQVLTHADLSILSFPSVKRGLEMGVKSLCMIPIRSGEDPLGVLKVARRTDRAFSPRDVDVLTQVAAAAVPLLESAQSLRMQELCEPLALLKVSNASHWNSEETEARSAPAGVRRMAPPHREPGKLIPFSSPEALSEPEQLLAAYFSSSTVGLCILDTELRYLAINHSLAEMNGVPASAHLGKNIREILGDVAAKIEAECKRVLATGQPILNLAISAVLSGRTEVGHWQGNYFPIKDAEGRVKQIGVVVVEMTEQKKLEESLRGLTSTLQQEKKRLQVLVEISELLGRSTDVPRIFPQISASIRRVLRHECAFVSLYDEKNNMFVRQAQDFPLGKGLLASSSAIISGGPQSRAVSERKSVIFSKDALLALRSEPAQEELANSFLAEGLKSLCCVPMLRPNGPMGTLTLASTRPEAFRACDNALLNQIASQLAIALENSRVAQEVDELNSRLSEEKKYLEGDLRTEVIFEGIIGESPALRQVLDQVATVAGSDATALVLGETGTGKELIARAIHRLSRRKERGFIKLNCAAIPTGLLESELFGHEKGAFTGAITQKIGRLELADQGTLFLDEIGEIPLELQPKLLRVLQDHEFERLGGIRTIKVNLRLVAATNRDLTKSISAGDFRSDLFYRLNVFPIRVPPLRERREDIPALVRYFVQRYAHQMDRHIESVPTETMKALIDWHWPGNVRELENLIERSVILSEGRALRVPLSELIVERQVYGASDTLENAEREHILRVLRETGGLISGIEGAAHKLGLKRTTLQSKMQRLRITRQDYQRVKPGW